MLRVDFDLLGPFERNELDHLIGRTIENVVQREDFIEFTFSSGHVMFMSFKPEANVFGVVKDPEGEPC